MPPPATEAARPPRPAARTAAVRSRAGSTQEDLRRHNLGTVLGLVHVEPRLTRSGITARIGVNRSTTAALVAELVALGAVQEALPSATAGVGRPSLLVQPCSESVHVLAVEVVVGRVVVARVGLGGRVLARRSRRLPATGQDGVPAVVRLVARLAAEVEGGTGSRRVGIGVSVPGAVRSSDGLVHVAPNLQWYDVPLGQLLAERFDHPVQVANDADLGALAEHRRGAAVGVDDVVFVATDVGVGGGALVGGQPLRGAGGYAGEVGHMAVDPAGPQCRCGARGCWETLVGTEAVGRALGAARPEHLPSVLEALSSHPDPAAALAGVGSALATGLANLANVLDPELVVLGGIAGHVLPHVRDVVEAELLRRTLGSPVRLALPALGGDAVLMGAAERAFDALLLDPVGTLAAAPVA